MMGNNLTKAERVARGLCKHKHCAKMAADDSTYCDRHLAQRRSWNRAPGASGPAREPIQFTDAQQERFRRKNEGICVACGEDYAVEGRERCTDCASIRVQATDHTISLSLRQYAVQGYGGACHICGWNDDDDLTIVDFYGYIVDGNQLDRLIETGFPAGYTVRCVGGCRG